VENTEEWGEKPWLKATSPSDATAAARMEALLPTLQRLQRDSASTLHTLRPDEMPTVTGSTATGITVSDEVLGRGGMSVVLLGRQHSLGRNVAIKTIGAPGDTKAALGSAEVSNVLLREAQITGRLEHPNVLPLYDMCVGDDGHPQLVLKRIEGRPWTEYIQRPELIEEEQPGSTDAERWHLQVFLQVCNAIRFAHARGVIHRDLKPDNVMIGAFGEVYVLDWGIAVRHGEPASGKLAGTPAYMAPEMASGELLDERTDVYLLGAVLYELFHQKPPHSGATFAMVMWSALTSRPSISDETPPGFAEVIRRAMQLLPAERFQSVEALQSAVVNALERRDAEVMCAEASRKLVELEVLLADSEAESVVTATVHELYGQARFAFRTVLDRFDDWEEAAEGQRRLHIAMARYALALGETASAEAYLARAQPAPPELLLAIEERRAQDASVTARLNTLEAFRSNLDRNNSRRRRFFLTVGLGIFWVAQGLYLQLTGGPEGLTYISGMLSPLVNSAVLLALLKLGKTWNRYDRRLLALTSLGFFAEFGLDVSLYVTGTSAAQALVHDLAIRGFMVGVLAIYVERALVIPAAMLGAGAFASAFFPSYVMWWVVSTNGIIMGVLAWRWRPHTRDSLRSQLP
jgi:hypothetical protein